MPISYIGSTISVSAAQPATEDQTGYEALSWTEVGLVVSFGELTDQSEEIAFNLLKPGRTSRVNGVKNIPEIPVMVDYDSSDAGMVILKAGNNSNTTHSFRVTDADGEDQYFQGLIANLGDPERIANAYKAKQFVIRSQTGVTEV